MEFSRNIPKKSTQSRYGQFWNMEYFMEYSWNLQKKYKNQRGRKV